MPSCKRKFNIVLLVRNPDNIPNFLDGKWFAFLNIGSDSDSPHSHGLDKVMKGDEAVGVVA